MGVLNKTTSRSRSVLVPRGGISREETEDERRRRIQEEQHQALVKARSQYRAPQTQPEEKPESFLDKAKTAAGNVAKRVGSWLSDEKNVGGLAGKAIQAAPAQIQDFRSRPVEKTKEVVSGVGRAAGAAVGQSVFNLFGGIKSNVAPGEEMEGTSPEELRRINEEATRMATPANMIGRQALAATEIVAPLNSGAKTLVGRTAERAIKGAAVGYPSGIARAGLEGERDIKKLHEAGVSEAKANALAAPIFGAGEEVTSKALGKVFKASPERIATLEKHSAEVDAKIDEYLSGKGTTRFRSEPKVNRYDQKVNRYDETAPSEPKINQYDGEPYTAGSRINRYDEPKVNRYDEPPTGTKENRTLRDRRGQYAGSKPTEKFRTNPDLNGQKDEEVEKSLMVLHNLSTGNYNKSKEIGGIANPSMAIIDSKKGTLDNFGDITLVGDRNLPFSGKAKTMGADVYSPRFPSTLSKVEDFEPIRQRLSKYEAATGSHISDIETKDIHFSLENSPLAMADFLTSKGESLPKGDRYDVRNGMRKIIEGKKYTEEFINYIDGLAKEAGVSEHIFTGYTPSGKHKTIPLTAENASKTMNKEAIRGGEKWNYGLGSVRSRVTPEFKTIEQIRKNQDKIVTKEQFEQLKDGYENVHMGLVEKLSKYDKFTDSNPFIARDQISESLSDYIGGTNRSSFLQKFEGIPEQLLKEIDDFKSSLKEMPTEYFETKFKRVVQPSEFKHAVIPDTTDAKTLEKLKNDGLNVITYKAGDAADRAAKIKELNDVKFRLSDDFKAATGMDITPEQESEIMALNKRLFGDENVKVTQQILANKDALGSYQEGMIKIVSGQADAKDTYYHEAVHKYFDVFSSREEQVNVLKEAINKYGTDDLAQVEEYLAEDFIQYAKSREGVVGTIKTYFDSVLNRIKSYIGAQSEIDQLYADITLGKARKQAREGLKPAETPVVKAAVEQPVTGDTEQLKENLANSKQELAAMDEAMQDHPGRKLAKYANQNRELPEVLGEGGKFSKEGDVFAQELGFRDSEEARAAYDDYVAMKDHRESMNTEVRDLQDQIKKANVKPPEINERGEEVVKVPKSALPAESKGETKVSRLEARIKNKLEALTDEDRAGLSEYNVISREDQIAKAAAFVERDPEAALAVLRGDKQAPDGLLHNSIFMALDAKAGEAGGSELALKLASLRSTRAGQELSMLVGRDPNSPVKYLDELREARYEIQGGREKVGRKIKDTVTEIQDAIKKTAPKKEDWASFVAEIRCS